MKTLGKRAGSLFEEFDRYREYLIGERGEKASEMALQGLYARVVELGLADTIETGILTLDAAESLRPALVEAWSWQPQADGKKVFRGSPGDSLANQLATAWKAAEPEMLRSVAPQTAEEFFDKKLERGVGSVAEEAQETVLDILKSIYRKQRKRL